MKIVGCDLHTRYQQIAMLDTETGELVERRLEHANGEARAFYTGLEGKVRVGIEATGHTRRVANPVNLLIAINLHKRVPHPAFLWRGGGVRLCCDAETSLCPILLGR